jgi:hypothetical protein
MAKISMLISDDTLAEIDASAGGNRTAFMVAAALRQAREMQRLREDQEIAAACVAHPREDAELMRDWEVTGVDGLD